LQDANEMHFPEDRQKFTRSFIRGRLDVGTEQTRTCITNAVFSTDFWDLFLPRLVDGVDKLIRPLEPRGI